MNPEAHELDPAILVDQAPDALIFADRDGLVRAWNPAAERIFGHPASDAIGQNLDIIIPEPLREAHWAGYARALEAGGRVWNSTRLRRPMAALAYSRIVDLLERGAV